MAKAKGISRMHARLNRIPQPFKPVAPTREEARAAKQQTLAFNLDAIATRLYVEMGYDEKKEKGLYSKWHFARVPAWMGDTVRTQEFDVQLNEKDWSLLIQRQVATDGYDLWFDDTRTPDMAGERPTHNLAIVARSTELAQRTIARMGCPKTLYLDYDLSHTSYGNTLEFIDWFGEEVVAKRLALVEDFDYYVLSDHHTGRWEVRKKMRDWYDRFEREGLIFVAKTEQPTAPSTDTPS